MYYIKENKTKMTFSGNTIQQAAFEASKLFLEESTWTLCKEYIKTYTVGQHAVSAICKAQLMTDVPLWHLKAIKEIVWTP